MPPTLRRSARNRTSPTILATPGVTGNTGWATFDGRVATQVTRSVDVHADPEALRTGTWFVVVDFEGRARAWQFRDVTPLPGAVTNGTAPPSPTPGPGPQGTPSAAPASGAWTGPDPDAWTSSMDRGTYEAAVRRIREHIREGDVYQANLCRVLTAPLSTRRADDGAQTEPDARALAARLASGNPAPHACAIHVPAATPGTDGHDVDPVWVVSASPELYLSLAPGPDGPVVTSGPIKGTARTPEGLGDKDRAENVMITDLVRNDLQHVCRPGSVEVSGLLAVEHHPGLVHLVSRVRGVLSDDVGRAPDVWRHLLAATFPPGSVSGAPKSSALRIIDALEPTPRGPYCGAIGWVDGDAGTASLAVGIRTFWWQRGTDETGSGTLHFGTGAGITWGSDPAAEWRETELKAERLVGLASSGPGPAVSQTPTTTGRMSP
ncbi:chorismate-binding protein [Myceligenerans indicum]|uniref:Anthranilate synthase component I family protein n=1 Tax=Myceligenerans indicum TaxID=2593663 RepID=A0ABS1LHI2_9MICO|nr:chorismate-binding protein [Myceligenerans indicum]MBL0885702.1 anthranilate synthase component I family protein [Myceligenerans indicum]